MSTSRRLFFAIDFSADLRQQIISWRAQHFPIEAGKPIAAANLHLTLAFLGEVSMPQQQALMQAVTRLQSSAFSLCLDDCGHWPAPGVVWLGMKRAPRGLLQLADWLRSRAARQGCYQSPMPFHPHITLLSRAVRPVALPAATPGWQTPITRFGLYATEFDNRRSRYILLESWRLQVRP